MVELQLPTWSTMCSTEPSQFCHVRYGEGELHHEGSAGAMQTDRTTSQAHSLSRGEASGPSRVQFSGSAISRPCKAGRHGATGKLSLCGSEVQGGE